MEKFNELNKTSLADVSAGNDVIVDGDTYTEIKTQNHVPLAANAALVLMLSGCILADTSIGGSVGRDVMAAEIVDTSIGGSVGRDVMATEVTDTSIGGSVGRDALAAEQSITPVLLGGLALGIVGALTSSGGS